MNDTKEKNDLLELVILSGCVKGNCNQKVRSFTCESFFKMKYEN